MVKGQGYKVHVVLGKGLKYLLGGQRPFLPGTSDSKYIEMTLRKLCSSYGNFNSKIMLLVPRFIYILLDRL